MNRARQQDGPAQMHRMPDMTLRTPPRYGRRAILSALASVGFTGLYYGIRMAADNQVGASYAPAYWSLFLAGVSLYYAAICTFLWRRGLRKSRSKLQKDPPCQSAANIL